MPAQDSREVMSHRMPHETLYGYCWCRRSVDKVQSLRSVCGHALVRDARVLLRVLPSVPVAFIAELLVRAVEDGRDRAAQLLVSVWPGSSLDLPAVVGGSCPLALHPKRAVATTAIVRAFVELALRGENDNLCFLNVTGFQLGRELMEFVERKMAVFSKKETWGSPRSLRCDFLIGEGYSFDIFCSLLQHRLGKKVLQFEVRNLEVEGVGEAKLLQLLEMLDPDALVGLSLAYNSLQNQGLLRVSERLRRFRGLVALDVSSNGVRRGDAQHYDYLSDTIRSLPRLRRLNIKSCRIGGYLNTLVARCSRELSHLDISACGLRQQDLRVIGRFQNLNSLVLSDNNLSHMVPELIDVLFTLEKLQVMLLSNCELRADSFVILWEALRICGSSLHWLDLSWNKLSEDNLAVIVGDLLLHYLPHLAHLLLPVPSNPSPTYFELIKHLEAELPHIRVQTDMV
ncbi:leucine-rich repeat-containing protein 14-like [Haemaphysalis longicornis]